MFITINCGFYRVYITPEMQQAQNHSYTEEQHCKRGTSKIKVWTCNKNTIKVLISTHLEALQQCIRWGMCWGAGWLFWQLDHLCINVILSRGRGSCPWEKHLDATGSVNTLQVKRSADALVWTLAPKTECSVFNNALYEWANNSGSSISLLEPKSGNK